MAHVSHYELGAACQKSFPHASAEGRPPPGLLRVSNLTHVLHDDTMSLLEMRLHSETAEGSPLPLGAACVDFMHCDVRRTAERAICRVHASPFGYHLSAWLPAAAAELGPEATAAVAAASSDLHSGLKACRLGSQESWNLTVALTWTRFDLASWSQNSSSADDAGCRSPPLEQPALLQLAVPPCVTTTLTSPKTWSQKPTWSQDPSGLCSRDALYRGGLGPKSERYTPFSCTLPRASFHTARAAVSGKWIHFVGASPNLELFGHLLRHVLLPDSRHEAMDYPHYGHWSGSQRFSTDPIFNAEARACDSRPNYWQRDHDARHPLQGYDGKNHSNVRARLSIMYNGHNFVCANGQGLPSLVTLHEAADAAAASGATPPSFNMTKRGAWLSELIRGGNATPGWLRERFVARGNKTLIAERRKQVVRLKDDGASLGWPEGPDVILLGSGHHDLRDPDFSLDSYAARLRAVWRLIRDAIPSSRRSPPHLIWMTPATVYARPEVLTSKKVVTCPSTNKSSPQVHYSHPHILYKLMGELSNAIAQEMGADVLDMDQIRELRPYDGDGMHCITGLVCKSDLDVLLRMLEIGPRTKHASAG